MKAFITASVLIGAFLAGVGFYVVVDSTVHAQAPAAYGFTTYADISGNSMTVQFSSTAGASCRWIQMIAPSGNAAVVRWGDANTSSSRGGLIAAGGGQFLPPLPITGGEPAARYDLTKLYTFVTTGDKLTVVCGQ